ncbi:MAG: helix-turn-helix domain-containing protein [Acidimicrobiales bacterium]
MTEQRRDIGRFIREQRKLAELSVRRLADMAGVSNPYLSQIERGLRKPSAEILQQLARALELSAETMYVQAGILDAEHRPEPPTLEAAIRSAPELTDDQRKALLGVYRSFLAANAPVVDGDDPLVDTQPEQTAPEQTPPDGGPGGAGPSPATARANGRVGGRVNGAAAPSASSEPGPTGPTPPDEAGTGAGPR